VLIRRLARPMLAAIFITGGINTLRHPEPHVQTAKPLVDKVSGSLPEQVPSEPQQLVYIDAGVKIAAGTLLALGKFPRLSSLALAGSIVPTTVAGHAFWEKTDPAEKAAEQVHFLKNVSILGGLILAAVDTEGKPSLGWRGRRAARKLAEQTRELTGSTDASSLSDSLSDGLSSARRNVVDGVDVAIGTFAA
jgi:putative oxidoreductase